MILTTLAAAAAVLAGPNEGSRASFSVLDRSLRATTGEIVSLTAEKAVLRAGGKEVTVEQPAAVVAAAMWGAERDWPGVPTEATGFAPSTVAVELIDRSLLQGDLLAGKGDGLVLVSPRLGRIDFTLEAMRSLWVGAGGRMKTPIDGAGKGSTDRVRLANGDTVEGFVEAIKTAAGGNGMEVAVERRSDKAKSTVPLERIAWVTLGGSSGGGAKSAPATTVWLTDGERTAAEEFSIDKREARLVRAKGALPARFEASSVEGAMLAPGALVPLAQCAATGSVVTGPEQPLGTRDLELAEPGRVTWTLPEGAKRITGWAVLPDECRRFGDCDVVLTIEGAAAPLKSFTLNAAAPVSAFDCELPAGKQPMQLTVKMTEGKHGPVQDRVVMRRVMLAK